MKQGPRVRVTHKEFEVKSDLIFLESGSAVINPDYVSIVRPFNFSNLNTLDTRLETLIGTHDAICNDMQKHSSQANKFVKATKRTRFREQAIRVCDRLGMKLPEVRNVTDAQDLARVMANNGDTQCHSGPYFETYYGEFLHNDATPARNDAITVCGQPALTYNYARDYGTVDGWTDKRHRPHRYKINSAHGVDLCYGDYVSLPVYCQVSTSFQAQIEQQIEICKHHNFDMMRAKDSVKASIDLLEQSLHVPRPHANAFDASAAAVDVKVADALPRMQRATFEELLTPWPTLSTSAETSPTNRTLNITLLPTPQPFLGVATATKLSNYVPIFSSTVADLKGTSADLLNRTKRGAFLFIVSAFSLVASILTLMASSAAETSVQHTYDDLKVDTSNVVVAMKNLDRDVHLTLSQVQTVSYQAQAEIAAYNAYLRILMSLQDNILSFQATIQALTYGQVTSQIISPVDIDILSRQLHIGGNMRLSRIPRDYIVQPVSINGTVAIQIDIPVVTKEKLVTLFAIQKYPTFKDQLKYQLDCPFSHIAIYDHSDSFHMLTENEYRNCLTPNSHCISRVPRLTSTQGNCASDQYFNIPSLAAKHVLAPDNSPFLFTYLNQTVFAVGQETPLTFHCPSNIKAGPDHEMTLHNRGIFVNPAFCSFEALGMRFTPPRNLHKMQTTLNEQFSVPDILDVPKISDFEQMSSDDVAIRLINFSNSTHLSTTKKWLIALSLLLLLFFIHSMLTYFWFSYRTLPFRIYGFINSYFNRDPPDQNRTVDTNNPSFEVIDETNQEDPPNRSDSPDLPGTNILLPPNLNSTLNLSDTKTLKPKPQFPRVKTMKEFQTLDDITDELRSLCNSSPTNAPSESRNLSPVNTIVSLPAASLRTGYARVSYKPASHTTTVQTHNDTV